MVNFSGAIGNQEGYDFEIFKTDFDDDEKIAVICILNLSATFDDKDPSENELVQINSVANIIGLNAMDEIFFEKASQGKKWIYDKLRSVIARKKEWFVVQLHALIGVDGIIKNERLEFNLQICKDFGIEHADYVFILYKAEEFIKLNNL